MKIEKSKAQIDWEERSKEQLRAVPVGFEHGCLDENQELMLDGQSKESKENSSSNACWAARNSAVGMEFRMSEIKTFNQSNNSSSVR